MVWHKSEHVVCGQQGNHVTIPITFNTLISPSEVVWRTPATTLYDKAVGTAFVSPAALDDAISCPNPLVPQCMPALSPPALVTTSPCFQL